MNAGKPKEKINGRINKTIAAALVTAFLYFPVSSAYQSHGCDKKTSEPLKSASTVLEFRPENRLESIVASYDNDNCGISDDAIKAMDEATYEIRTESPLLGPGGIIKFKVTGTGILLKGGYFLTANHNTQISTNIELPFGDLKITKKDFTSYLVTKQGDDYELEKAITSKGWIADERIDFALFKLKDSGKGKLREFPYKIGRSDSLKKGDFLYVLGNVYGNGINLFTTTVGIETQGDGYFAFRETSNKGDSGGPVFALKKKQPELVGLLVEGRAKTGYDLMIPYAVGVSSILRKISEYSPELARLLKQ